MNGCWCSGAAGQRHWPASWPQQLLPLARTHDASVLLDGDLAGALVLGEGAGVLLAPTGYMHLRERPLPWRQPLGVRCHDAAGLAQATVIGADFAILAPSAPSIAGTARLQHGRFRSLVEVAALPVYASGRLRRDEVAGARQAGGQGVAGIPDCGDPG